MREGWRTAKLRDLFAPSNARLGAHSAEPAVFSVSKYDGVIPAEDFFGKRVASADLSTYKLLPDQAWVYSTIHIDEGSIARNNLEADGVVSPMYTVMNWTSRLDDPRYVEHLLRSREMLATYADNAQGSINRRRSLAWKSFSQIEVKLPPLAEQQRIVDLIAAVDDATEAAEGEALSSRRLVDDLRESLFARYETVAINDLVENIEGGRSVQAENRPPGPGEPAVIKLSAVTDSGFVPTEAKVLATTDPFNSRMLIHEGDLLITRANTAERVGMVSLVDRVPGELYLSDKTLRISPTAGVHSEALLHALKSRRVRRQLVAAGTGTSASMKNISQKDILRTTTGWPQGAEEQKSIADILSDHMAAVDAARATADALRTLRSNLLTVLLSGEHEIPANYDQFLNLDEEATA